MDWQGIAEYIKSGISHILTGIDHLLFASTLIIAIRGFWEVFKVIGVFTLAHSITITATALHGAPLIDSRIVEPLIGASIVYVALENIFRRDSAVSTRRLGIAFGFGLVHGLAFGGILLENLAGLPAATLGWAIAAFCVGVEIGHILVVGPLSGMVKIGSDAGGEPFRRGLQKWGSAVLAAGGVYYILAAFKLVPQVGG